MARFVVTEYFHTATRRFYPGMEVEIEELAADSPVPPERWRAMGKAEELPPRAPDFVSEQARLREAWRASDEPLAEGAPVLIGNLELYGTAAAVNPDAVEVQVFGENTPRRYPAEKVNPDMRTVREELVSELVEDAPAEEDSAPEEPHAEDGL